MTEKWEEKFDEQFNPCHGCDYVCNDDDMPNCEIYQKHEEQKEFIAAEIEKIKHDNEILCNTIIDTKNAEIAEARKIAKEKETNNAREIKFRLLHKDGKMLYEDRIGDCIKWYNEGQGKDLMQYTGLKDKNGKEIYEGDIVKIIWEEINENYIGDIYWNGDRYSVRGAGDKIVISYWHTIEVIGNIYENPELLEKEKGK